jgi:hypothetical protein
MTEESIQNPPENKPKTKRAYNRRQPPPTQPQPIVPNIHIAELESGLVPLVNQRLEANRRVSLAAAKANQANLELSIAQNEFQQIEGEIQYRMQLIGQMKNGGMPIPQQPYVAQNLQPQFGNPYAQPPAYSQPSAPYNPIVPFPPVPGVGSMPAQNRGLYPDATDRLESAEDVRMFEMQQGRRV